MLVQCPREVDATEQVNPNDKVGDASASHSLQVRQPHPFNTAGSTPGLQCRARGKVLV